MAQSIAIMFCEYTIFIYYLVFLEFLKIHVNIGLSGSRFLSYHNKFSLSFLFSCLLNYILLKQNCNLKFNIKLSKMSCLDSRFPVHPTYKCWQEYMQDTHAGYAWNRKQSECLVNFVCGVSSFALCVC